ncbi:hypothetical protein CFOL_v3_26864 [Cephalotus follicularis]|uniref:Uncharacterized protein n=1 Tax=Cephalotus follicularis TaxID=3775 RepID=A0A1Q3CT61_CEPFO|nr:hypothetical protein CFOL_v3_26864 [Cephalotus follicularis]
MATNESRSKEPPTSTMEIDDETAPEHDYPLEPATKTDQGKEQKANYTSNAWDHYTRIEAFSIGGRMLDALRTSLTPRMVGARICSQNRLRSAPCLVEIKENFEDLQRLENDLKDILSLGLADLIIDD